MPDDCNRLAFVQTNTVEYLRMSRYLIVRCHRAVQLRIHVENASDASDPGQYAILLGKDRSSGALIRIHAGIAGRISRGPVLRSAFSMTAVMRRLFQSIISR